MKLFKHTGYWSTPIEVCDLGLGLTPRSVLVEWFGAYYMAPKELLANGLEQLGIHRKMTPKDRLPVVAITLDQCIPVPQAVARVLIDEFIDQH